MVFCNNILKKIKLVLMYFKYIVFTKNHFCISFSDKIYANIKGYLADQYVLYDFKNNDYNEYLSEMDWHRSKFINGKNSKLLNNKYVCSNMLSKYIKTPKVYYVKKKNNIKDYNYLFDILKNNKSIFFKPISGGKGIGVHLLEYINNKIYIDKKLENEEKIKKLFSKKEYILCEVIEQHDYISNIYNKTFNTIRILTIRDIKTNKMEINFAVQRIGINESIPVDNGSRGGLVSKIDLETGILTSAKSLHTLDKYIYHPNSKKIIEGIKVPNWEKIKKDIVNLSNKFDCFDIIAWDILLMSDGNVCVIEANNTSGVNILQLWGGLKKEKFGIFLDYHRNSRKKNENR